MCNQFFFFIKSIFFCFYLENLSSATDRIESTSGMLHIGNGEMPIGHVTSIPTPATRQEDERRVSSISCDSAVDLHESDGKAFVN